MRAACDTGGATLMAAGLNPGFIAEQVATPARDDYRTFVPPA